MNTELTKLRHGAERLSSLGEDIKEHCWKTERDHLLDALGAVGQAEKLAGLLYVELQRIIALRDAEGWPQSRP
jgi:hypothetical protein